VEELDALVAEHPLQERLRAQLMLALYRNGRQAEALEVYREGRRALVEQLGVEPAPELRRLEQAILRQAPELDAPIGAPPRTWRGGSRAWSRNAVLAAAATLLVGAIALLAVGLVRGPSGTSTSGIPPNSVAVIDAATARSTADLPVGQASSSIAVSDNSVWVLNQLNATLTRIDGLHQRIAVTAIPLTSYVNAALTSIAVADGAVWAVDSGESSLTRVGISPREVVHVALPGWARYSSDYMTLATGAGQLWITSSHLSSVLEADQRSGQVASRIAVPGYPSAAAFGGGAVWCIAAEHGGGLVARIDPATHRVVASIPLLGTPTALATGFSAVWVAIANRNLLYKIDESTNAVVRTIAVRGAPVAVAVGAGGVWVVAGQRRRLIRIDPASGATTATVALNGTPHALAVADGRVWVLGA